MSSSPTAGSRRTALDALHRSLGATMTDFAGWDMPLRYGSERDEHLAVRTRAGLFDLSHMGEITVTGPQAAALLDHALVGNIGGVKPGRARYTMICREDGGILDDLIVYRLRPRPEYMVVANASNAQVVLDALVERSAGFDAEVRDDRDAYALIAVQGPESPGHPGRPHRRRPRRPEVLRGPARHGRRGPRADRAHRLHRRGRLRAVREAGARRRAVAGADQGGRGRRPGPLRAVLPGHAAPGGGHAAVRARAVDRADPLRRRARPGREVREGGRLRRARGADGGRRARRLETRRASSSAWSPRAAGSRAPGTRSSPAAR